MTTKKQTENVPIDVREIGGRQYVYGLRGIQELFHVSHATAQKLKNGVLNDAVLQQGRILLVDVERAIELFSNKK